MTHEPNLLIKSLEEVLDLERAALVDGDLERLNHMVPEKEKLIGAINDLQVLSSDDLIRVHQKVERNQALLNSAAEGIAPGPAGIQHLRGRRAAQWFYRTRSGKAGKTRIGPELIQI